MLLNPIAKRSHHSKLYPSLSAARSAGLRHKFHTSTVRQPPQRVQHQKKNANMSWMDSWSRPSKSQATPVPYYLLPGGENTPYCHSCGRVIGQRKTNAAATSKTEAKYCSARCRGQRPGRLDRELEAAFLRLLTGQEALASGGNGAEGRTAKTAASRKEKGSKKVKGDQRILVPCSAVEDLVFGKKEGSVDGGDSARSGSPEPETEHDEHGAGGKEAPRIRDDPTPREVAEGTVGEVKSSVDGDLLARMSIRSGTRIRPPQSVSEVNGSVGGEKGWKERVEEDDEMLEKRRQGQRRAKEKEMVKCAARRGVVFGFATGPAEGGKRGAQRMCEAVMNGKVVEPSFAKGDWSVRWRE